MCRKIDQNKLKQQLKTRVRVEKPWANRGWYIVAQGVYFVNRDGTITHGVTDPATASWTTPEEANAFMAIWQK